MNSKVSLTLYCLFDHFITDPKLMVKVPNKSLPKEELFFLNGPPYLSFPFSLSLFLSLFLPLSLPFSPSPSLSITQGNKHKAPEVRKLFCKSLRMIHTHTHTHNKTVKCAQGSKETEVDDTKSISSLSLCALKVFPVNLWQARRSQVPLLATAEKLSQRHS